jgi:AraC family transcriptional regulator
MTIDFSRVVMPEVHERRLRKVLAIIFEVLPSHSVQELASAVHLSRAHLQRLFKRETGVHLSSVLAECRLQKAAELLSASDMPIKEIAYAAGYEHHSSFVRAFKQRFAETPARYRLNTNIAKC